ncbi:MAG: dienelactone hydrolase family protein [Magnetovibrio sp.]|nr:dienelactone hydrolase family protein [Magnetovibrio sp.]
MARGGAERISTCGRWPKFGLAILALLAGAASVAAEVRSEPLATADGLAGEHAMLPVVIDGDEVRLETIVVGLPDGEKKPLAVISHGSPRGGYTNRRKMTPHRYLRAAETFAYRGYLAVIVMRREFGESEGSWSSDFGFCDNPDYVWAGRQAGAEIGAAIRALAERADVDATRVLLVGQSAGGFASIALSAEAGSKISAVVNFAGGRGSRRPGEVCTEDALIDAFATYGRTSRTPTLFLYAENDKYFGPDLATRFHQAFTGAGGQGPLALVGAFGSDGHDLFSRTLEGIGLWRDRVEAFLDANGLPARRLVPAADGADPAPPSVLSSRGREHWRRYLLAPKNKAFAVSDSGRFGWRSGRRTIGDAKDGAFSYCKRDCAIVSINGTRVR